MAPWAFIGFENISHSDREFAFSRKKSFRILVVAVVTTTLLYIFVILLSISAFPPEYRFWTAYLEDLNNLQGIKNLPAFYAAQYYLGDTGIYLLAAALLSLVLTSLIGNMVALSRLFYAVAKDEILPDRYAELNERKNPERAVELIILLSLGIPLLGRTAVGWIVDITTIGAIIVYGMVSAAAYKVAKDRGLQTERVTGAVGFLVMVVFALLMIFPNLFTNDALQKETYFLITAWSILGFLFLRNILNRDYERNFGRSVIVWVAFLALILFMELNWLRTANLDFNLQSIESIRNYYMGGGTAEQYALGDKIFLENLKEQMRLTTMENNSIVLALFLFALAMFFSNYAVVKKRADETEAELDSTRNLAFRDSMTGVKSKLAYTEAVGNIDRKIAEKTEGDFAVVVCDVNGLKHINDTLGHKAGDEYIRSASKLICEYFKHSPVFRTGGDEFVVILEGRDFENRALLMKAMDKRVEANIALQEVVVSASYSDFDKEKDTKFHDAFERADALMYERKKWLKKMGARTRE
jgi:diguanylate cyclase (GGDEF)-like protein